MTPRTLARIIAKFLINSFAVWLATYLIHDIHYTYTSEIFVVAIVLGLLNTFLKPFLQLISVPFILFSLGLFLIIINAVMLLLAAEIVTNFHVDSFWAAVWGSLIISAVNYLLDPPKRKEETD